MTTCVSPRVQLLRAFIKKRQNMSWLERAIHQAEPWVQADTVSSCLDSCTALASNGTLPVARPENGLSEAI